MSDQSVKETLRKHTEKSAEKIQEENDGLFAELKKDADEKDKQPKMDPEILKKLKGKLAKEEEPMNVIHKQEVSIELCFIGVGQAGGRIAERCHKLGYDVGVINTSPQDLKFIDVLPEQKLLIPTALGGTGKDLDLSRQIFSENKEEIQVFVEKISSDSHMIFLAISGGGGSGSGSIDTMIPMLYNTGKPVGVIYVLPKATEDAQSKKNSLETLARLAKFSSSNIISSLIVVDNARIENIYGGLSQAEFWEKSNHVIVEPIHLFNHLTSQASKFTSLDPTDFGKIISCGDCSIYGVIEVDNYMEETALAEAVIESLNTSMLAEGFDISQTRVGGVIITGPESALRKLPSVNINYAYHMISEQTNGANIYQGIYSDDSIAFDKIKIYTWFAGLGLPQSRIDVLKKESQQQSLVSSEKEKQRAAAMAIDLNKNETTSMKDEIHRKIEQKKTGFSKLQSSSIIDKRRK